MAWFDGIARLWPMIGITIYCCILSSPPTCDGSPSSLYSKVRSDSSSSSSSSSSNGQYYQQQRFGNKIIGIGNSGGGGGGKVYQNRQRQLQQHLQHYNPYQKLSAPLLPSKRSSTKRQRSISNADEQQFLSNNHNHNNNEYAVDRSDEYSTYGQTPLVVPTSQDSSLNLPLIECTNDTMRQDFGTACLKKVINSAQNSFVSDSTTARTFSLNPSLPIIRPIVAKRPTGKPSKYGTRYFSVKPMMSSSSSSSSSLNSLNNNRFALQGRNSGAGVNGGFKSPALNARKLYESKGYRFPLKSIKTVSGNNVRYAQPLSPVNRFYSLEPKTAGTTLTATTTNITPGFILNNPTSTVSRYGPGLAKPFPTTAVSIATAAAAAAAETGKNGVNTDEDEWKQDTNDNTLVQTIPIDAANGQVDTAASNNDDGEVMKPTTTTTSSSSSSSSKTTFGSVPSGEYAYAEELELLESLKRSLGILSAQGMNLKQRTTLLYREARRRRLYFFDALLGKTYNYLNTKQSETREAINDIDQAIGQIKRHHQVAAYQTLRQTFYIFESDGKQLVNHRSRAAAVPQIDAKELDRLIMEALAHAKKMMSVIRELNEALDEFEEQFNLPRFEPNHIDENNNSIEHTNEDF